MFKTVYSRILTIVLAIVLGLLVVFGVVVSLSFREFYLEDLENRLTRELDGINEIVVEKYVDVDKREKARDELRVIVRLYDAYLQLIFDSEELGRYNVYNGDSGSRWAVAEESDLSAYAEKVKSGVCDRAAYDLLENYVSFKTMTAMRPITTADGETLGVIFFHYDMTGVNRSINDTTKSVALFSAIAIALAIPLVMLFVRSVTHPIYDMTEVVKDYSKGNFSRRANERGKDELANLARTFNSMADELATLEDARRSFVANVSHELRSPLTSMRGFLEAMSDGTIPLEDRDAYIDIVLDENRRMTVMVNDLLDLARIESGQYKLSMSVFDVNELIRRTVITFMARIEAKGLSVQAELPDAPVYVEADETRITQVIHNLVDNAVKYSPDGDSLKIEETVLRHRVSVSIINGGPGISEADLAHVFDRFYKGEKAHTPSGTSGTGLGLSIAKLIMDQHEQEITAESKNGETRFTFTLKRTAKPKEPRPQEKYDAFDQ
ncbi:MAG: cell wall metabolism sensor histidine kinase WalK [Clostridiales bacterium]|nr:cell wall metabolism sensor histidine kinase WalK [Clostridiales bacterium]